METSRSSSSPDFDKLSRAAVETVLEECSDALTVYQKALRIEQQRVVERRRPHRAANVDYWQPRVPQPPALPEASMKILGKNIDQAAFAMAADQVVFQKLLQDGKWLQELVTSSKRSLATEGNLDVLVNETATLEAVRRSEEELLARARDFQEQYDRLQCHIKEEREKRKDEEARLKAEVLKLQNEKEKSRVKSRVESGYVSAWLDSRREQEIHRGRSQRDQLAGELEKCRAREDNERLVNRNVDSFLRKSIQENEKGAEDWAVRRQRESKSCEAEIRRLQLELDKWRDDLEVLKRQYEERQEFIDLCMAEREQARRAKQLEDHIRGCAVRIQSWWRGVMVRRKLGPYRPEEKKRKRAAKPNKK